MNKNKKTALVPRLRFPEFVTNGAVNFEPGNVIFEPISNKNHNSDLPVLAITQEHGAIPRSQIDYNVAVTDKSLQSYKVVEIGDFIISLRSFQGGIEYSLFHGICSPAYIILRNRIPIVEQYYKYYFKTDKLIQDLNKDLEGIRDGKMVSYRQFSAIMLPKPDCKEQQKIADCLYSLDELIAAEDEKLEALKLHKKGLMQKLLPAEGENVPQVRFDSFTDIWVQRKLGEVVTIKSGWTPSNFENGSNLFIKVDDLNYSARVQSDSRMKVANNPNMKKIRKGSIIFPKRGASIMTNKARILGEDGYMDTNMMALEPSCEIDGDFLYTFICNTGLYKIADTSSIPQINNKHIAPYSFAMPSIPEQMAIGNFFYNLDELVTLQKERIEALKLHKKGLMHGLFPSTEEVGE